ncbi:MAG TPA: gamma-glutamylcyclotransferase family protein [Chloroflexota bacterium]|nr:gamma-glutamylcyclotransferase family protein [Chloroflexota bacterium]
MPEFLYFAYGSNLDPKLMKNHCPQSREDSVGTLRGYRLGFTFYSSGWGGGTADIVPDSQGEVWGLIYALSPDDLDFLDSYEGHPTKYRRLQVAVDTSDGLVAGVWTYAVVDKEAFIQPTASYLAILTHAAEHYRFPTWYRSMLHSTVTDIRSTDITSAFRNRRPE